MSSQASKKQDPVELFITGFFKGIVGLFKSLIYGAKKLKSPVFLIIFAAAVVISLLAYNNKLAVIKIIETVPQYIQLLIFYSLVAFPIFVLSIFGSGQLLAIKTFAKNFENINFVGKDNNYPFLIYKEKKKDGKTTVYAFKSNIPLETWQARQAELETELDCNILVLCNLKSKKHVELTTIDSKYQIPEEVSWNNEYCILWDNEGDRSKDGIIIVGENAYKKILFNLNRTPHMLAAGETGSGKSVILRTVLWQLVKNGAIIFMLDFKGGVEFGLDYEKYGEVITERKQAIELLELLVEENRIRLDGIRASKAKNLMDYNRKTGQSLTRIGVFCDEIAEMLDKKGATGEDKEDIDKLTGLLSTLARLSRATGINLFMGVQRPDANVLTGQIKNNIPIRICGRFADKSASEIVLGNTKATGLPDIKGRFLYKVAADTIPFQAYYFDDDTMLEEVDRKGQQVLLPELTKHLVSSPAASASEPMPEEAQQPVRHKPSSKREKVTKLDFDYRKRKAVNK